MKRLSLLSFLALSAPLSVLLAADPAPDTTPVAKVGSVVLTQGQLQKDMGPQLYDAENRLYRMKKQWITQQAKNILFAEAAQKAGMSLADWQKKEIDSHLTPPSDAEIQPMMERYKGQVPEDQLRKAIINQLTMTKRQAREDELYQQLTKSTPVEVLLPKPAAPHVDVHWNADDPVKGPKDAPVTIVEFSDFQCPYCKASQEKVQRIEAEYPKDVKIVARQYPLPMHNRAKPAAEAALCAKDQGKYWAYRNKLFPSQSLEDSDFQKFAKDVGLNMKKFDACLAEHKHAAEIDATMAEAQKYGVTGTPAFFINGRPVVGNLDYSEFKDAIDDELAAAKKKG